MKRGIKRKIRRSRPLRINAPDLVVAYRDSHDRCEVCRISTAQCRGNRLTPGLDPHHLARGANRSDEICNLLMVCQLCHTAAHCSPGAKVQWGGKVYPAIPLGAMLKIKRLEYPDEWDQERLLLLTRGELAVERGGCELDEETDLPEIYMEERKRWQPAY